MGAFIVSFYYLGRIDITWLGLILEIGHEVKWHISKNPARPEGGGGCVPVSVCMCSGGGCRLVIGSTSGRTFSARVFTRLLDQNALGGAIMGSAYPH